MSYEKINTILKGLKIDEAGVRDFKETGKILSDINAKLKETNNVKLLQDILKYVTNEVDKDTSGTFTVANDTFHLPLQKGEGGKLCDCINEVVRQKIIKRLRSLVQKKFKNDLIEDLSRELKIDYSIKWEEDFSRDWNISPVPVERIVRVNLEIEFYSKKSYETYYLPTDKFNSVKYEISSLIENIFRKEMPDFYKNKFIRKRHQVPDMGSSLYIYYEIPKY